MDSGDWIVRVDTADRAVSGRQQPRESVAVYGLLAHAIE